MRGADRRHDGARAPSVGARGGRRSAPRPVVRRRRPATRPAAAASDGRVDARPGRALPRPTAGTTTPSAASSPTATRRDIPATARSTRSAPSGSRPTTGPVSFGGGARRLLARRPDRRHLRAVDAVVDVPPHRRDELHQPELHRRRAARPQHRRRHPGPRRRRQLPHHRACTSRSSTTTACENDQLYTGVVEDSLLDGCYVAFSARPSSGDSVDGQRQHRDDPQQRRAAAADADRLQGPRAGQRRLLQVGRRPRPRAAARRARQRVPRRPAPEPPDARAARRATRYECSNNVVVWLGKGRYPDKLPKCFTVTRDRAVWDRAVAAWQAAHPLNP